MLEYLHDYQFHVILFDLLRDLIEAVTAHHPRAIGHKHNFPFVLELLAEGDDHLHGDDNRRDRWLAVSKWVSRKGKRHIPSPLLV